MGTLKHINVNGTTYDLSSGHVFFGTLKYYAHDPSRNYNPTIQIDTVNHDFDFQKGSILKLAFLYYIEPNAAGPILDENYTLPINNDNSANIFIIDGVTFTNTTSSKSIRLIKIGYNQVANDNNITFKRGQIIDYVYIPDFSYAGGTAIPTLIADRSFADFTMKVAYGTCNTTASITTKAVTCSDFNPDKGSIIGIYFSTSNTAGSPTLDINSTGAVTIYKGGSAIDGTTNSLKWSANTILYFLYDGTYYRYITSMASNGTVRPEGAGSWYGTSDSSATTGTKTSSITNYSLVPGTIVNITFANANIYTSAALTLNINSTGAKTIYYNGNATSSSNTLLWGAYETLTFVYSGTYYYYVGRSGYAKNIETIQDNIGVINNLNTPSTVNLVSSINSINILHQGEEIPANSDLDDYINIGTYYCLATNVESIINVPALLYSPLHDIAYNYKEGFKLIVSQHTPQQLKQQLIATATQGYWIGAVWFRYGDSQQAWGHWHRYLTVDQDTTGDHLEPYDPMGTNLASTTFNLGMRNISLTRTDDTLGSYNTKAQDLTLGSTHSKNYTTAGGIVSKDGINKIISFVTGGVDTDGTGYLSLQARNTSSSINQVNLYKEEDGTNRVSLTSPAAWRSALGVPAANSSGLTNAATWRSTLNVPALPNRATIASGTTKSLTNNSNTNITNYTLSAGLWLINVHASFASSSVGRRAVFFSNSSTGGAASVNVNANMMAVNGATTVLDWTTVLDPTSSTKYYINGFQNSGSALTVTLYAYGFKLA